MRDLNELEKIVNTTMGGPLLSVAAKELVKWAKAYRELAIERTEEWSQENTGFYDVDGSTKEVDAEARKIAEGLNESKPSA